jgi:renalase
MTKQVIIIGAGIAGLMAARTLKQQGYAVTVLDKGQSVGGRMATRRLSQGQADTGAQFFTARTPEFQAQIEQWIHQDLISIWGYGWSDGSVKRTFEDGHPRYVAKQGMNALTKELARDLKDIHLNVEVASIESLQSDGWRVTDKNGSTYAADILLLTAPVPQSLTLLKAGSVTLTEADQETLERIEYGPCLCGIFAIDGDVALPDPGALQDFEKTVYWIADNKRKGISSITTITAHAEARYSREHYDAPDDETLALMQQSLRPYMGLNAKIIESQLKKWRYSIPLTTHPEDFYQLEGQSLYFAGDAFGGRGRVEGAYFSGVEAGRAIGSLLEE